MKISGIQIAIDKATSETLLRSDFKYNAIAKDLINSRPDIPKEAILCLKKRITSKNPKVQFLTLELLEFLVNNTSFSFHLQVASKDFLDILSQLYRNPDTDNGVGEKLKYILVN